MAARLRLSAVRYVRAPLVLPCFTSGRFNLNLCFCCLIMVVFDDIPFRSFPALWLLPTSGLSDVIAECR